MQKPPGTWTKVAAVTAVVCVLLGIGYALLRTYLHKTGYFWEVRLANGQKFYLGDPN